MRIGPVISNATPLVALSSIGKLTLLRDLYGEILIPQAVYEEFVATQKITRQTSLDKSAWIKVKPLVNPRDVLVYVGLDRGESEVLTLANEQSARLVIIDEKRARRYAERLGLSVTGTIGILLTAKRWGFLPTVSPLLHQLLAQGIFLSPNLITQTLQDAGEE